MLKSGGALRQGSTQRGQKADVTAVTAGAGVSRPTPNRLFTVEPTKFRATTRVYNNTTQEGTTMFGLLVFAAILAFLIALAGPPYPRTWKQRWGN